jgi:hypothetical protein
MPMVTAASLPGGEVLHHLTLQRSRLLKKQLTVLPVPAQIHRTRKLAPQHPDPPAQQITHEKKSLISGDDEHGVSVTVKTVALTFGLFVSLQNV